MQNTQSHHVGSWIVGAGEGVERGDWRFHGIGDELFGVDCAEGEDVDELIDEDG